MHRVSLEKRRIIASEGGCTRRNRQIQETKHRIVRILSYGRLYTDSDDGADGEESKHLNQVNPQGYDGTSYFDCH
jgi:hypothetical protein